MSYPPDDREPHGSHPADKPLDAHKLVWVTVENATQDELNQVSDILSDALPSTYHPLVSSEDIQLLDAGDVLEALRRLVDDPE